MERVYGEIDELFKIISDDFRRTMDKSLKEFDLSLSQIRALEVISKSEKEITQRDLELALNISHAATHGLLKRLEKKGFVTTRIDKNDRRNVLISMTEEGQNKLDVLDKVRTEKMVSLVLEPEEQENLLRIMRKLAARTKSI